MKNSFSLLCLLSVLSLASCKKKELKVHEPPPEINTGLTEGLPENARNINGYFYACKIYNAALENTSVFSTYAAFSDPGSSLPDGFNKDIGKSNSFLGAGDPNSFGNVHVGDVFVNGQKLGVNLGQLSLFYNDFNVMLSTTISPTWKAKGNSTFKPLDITLLRNIPVMKVQTSATLTIDTSEDLVFNTAQIASGYDSLIVIVGALVDAGGQVASVRAAVPAGAPTLTLSKEKLQSFDFKPGNIYFYAYNYSHITIANKVYLFELGNRSSQYITITP